MRAIISIILVLLLIGTTMVSAAEVRSIENLIRIDPENPEYYTDTFNWSDPDNADLTNYEQLVVPFMNDTNISGTFSGTFMPPILTNLSDDESPSASWVSSVARFKSQWIMSGSSYSWWRAPINNITGFFWVNLTIWHVDNPSLLDITSDYGEPNIMSKPTKIYRNLYNSSGENLTWYNQTTTAWGWEWNLTWFRVVAPIHSDESYYVRWMYWHSEMDDGQQIMLAQTDTGDDHINTTWYYSDDADEISIVGMDMDMSVIHEYGMGYAVSGVEVPVGIGGNLTIRFYSTLDDPIENGEYLSFMLPFFHGITTDNNVRVYITDWNTTWYDEWWVVEDDGAVDFTLHSSLWTKAYSCSIFFIQVEFTNETNLLYIWDQFSDFNINDDDSSSYNPNRFRCVNHPWASSSYYFYFTLFHSLQATNGSWVNDQLPSWFSFEGMIVTIDMLEEVHYSDPWYIKAGKGISKWMYVMYTIGDKIILGDLLPDMNYTQFLEWVSDEYNKFYESWPSQILLAIGTFVVQFAQFLVKWAPYVLSAILTGLNLFIFIPIWVTCVLIINGLKRYFVILAKDGPEVASDYADEFVRNCVKSVKGLPAVKVGGKVVGKVAGRLRR